MAFGQQSGPPAAPRQVSELLGLLNEAGHTDFRDARGPMGFTQRQAGGKFTRDEAEAFIEQLPAPAGARRRSDRGEPGPRSGGTPSVGRRPGPASDERRTARG